MKFKVGDRVEYIGNDPYDPLSYGDKGTVIALGEYRTHDVEWDKRDSRMHNGDGNGRNHHCWIVREREIRKVKEKEKMTENEVTNALMKVLGVKVGEKFTIVETSWNPYCFREDGKLIDCYGDSREDYIGDLAFGLRHIQKIPVKKMTVSEIEKELGYKIKVIADKEEKK